MIKKKLIKIDLCGQIMESNYPQLDPHQLQASPQSRGRLPVLTVLSEFASKIQITLWGKTAWITHLTFLPGWWFHLLLGSDGILRCKARRGGTLGQIFLS